MSFLVVAEGFKFHLIDQLLRFVLLRFAFSSQCIDFAELFTYF